MSLKIRTLYNTDEDADVLRSYLQKCENEKIELYCFHFHASYVGYPINSYAYFLSAVDFMKRNIDRLDDYGYGHKFFVKDFKIVSEYDNYDKCDYKKLQIGFSKRIYIRNIDEINLDGKVFYSSLFGGTDELYLTIPVEIFDNWSFQSHPISSWSSESIKEQINCLNDEKKDVINKILYGFDLNIDCCNVQYMLHEQYEVLKKVLDQFDIYV